MCAWFGCIQSSHPAASMIGPGQPVVVGVGVRADEEPDVLEPQAGLGERPLELPEGARLRHSGVHEHHAAARRDGKRVDVGYTRPGQWQPQVAKFRAGSDRRVRVLAFSDSSWDHCWLPRPWTHPLGIFDRCNGQGIGQRWATPRKQPPVCSSSARGSSAAVTRSSRTGWRRQCSAAGSDSVRAVQQHAGIEVPPRVECALGARQRLGERVRSLTVVPGPVIAPDGVVVGDRPAAVCDHL